MWFLHFTPESCKQFMGEEAGRLPSSPGAVLWCPCSLVPRTQGLRWLVCRAPGLLCMGEASMCAEAPVCAGDPVSAGATLQQELWCVPQLPRFSLSTTLKAYSDFPGFQLKQKRALNQTNQNESKERSLVSFCQQQLTQLGGWEQKVKVRSGPGISWPLQLTVIWSKNYGRFFPFTGTQAEKPTTEDPSFWLW